VGEDTYARGAKPAPGLVFDQEALPKTTPLPKQTIDQLQRMEAELGERDEKLSALLADKTALDDELKRLRAEIAAAKKANTAQADTHNYSEAETRDYFIDLPLKEAGWALDQERDREFPVEGMLETSGLAKPEQLAQAKAESNGLGIFVRSLVGLDREAAKSALAGFIKGKTLAANQIEFVNLVIEHLTEHGVMDTGLLYESPFTALNPQGPEGVFDSAQVDELVTLLSEVRARAVA
jgi:hypothetical protein